MCTRAAYFAQSRPRKSLVASHETAVVVRVRPVSTLCTYSTPERSSTVGLCWLAALCSGPGLIQRTAGRAGMLCASSLFRLGADIISSNPVCDVVGGTSASQEPGEPGSSVEGRKRRERRGEGPRELRASKIPRRPCPASGRPRRQLEASWKTFHVPRCTMLARPRFSTACG